MEQLWLPFPDDGYRPYPDDIYYSPAFLALLKRNTSCESIEKANKEARKRAKKLLGKGHHTLHFRY